MAQVVTIVNQVNIPLRIQQDGTSQSNNAKQFLVSVVIQAADYSSGISTSSSSVIATTCGVNKITSAIVDSVQVTAGTVQFGFGVHDIANDKLRFFTAITNQTTATDYTAVNGDIWRILVTGV